MLFLCGCDSGEILTESKDYSFAAQIYCDEAVYECSGRITDGKNIAAEITKPDSLAGFTYIYGEQSYIEYNGLKSTAMPAEKSVTDYLSILPKVMGVKAKKQGEEYFVETELNGEECTVKFASTGLPLSISGRGTEIIIFNVTLS